MIGDRVTVQYSCECGLVDRGVRVPARTEGEVITSWLDHVVMPLVATDHRHTSPLCRTKKVQNVKFQIA